MIIGTRKSRLALAQAELVKEAIRADFPDMALDLAGYETKGDRQSECPLSDLGGRGAFTRELERAMQEGRVDIAVHSAKDMPMALPEGLEIGAVLKREDNRDVWISCHQGRMADCMAGTVVGTGSRRRALQAETINAGLEITDIRGNVPTRLKKLADGRYDAIILAAAGLKRLGYLKDMNETQGSFVMDNICFYYEYLPQDQFLPAAGQGIIAVESRKDDCREVLAGLHDEETWLLLTAERAFLKTIGGGCNEPAGIASRIEKNQLTLKVKYWTEDKQVLSAVLQCQLTGSIEDKRKIAAKAGWRAAICLKLQEDSE